MADIADHIMDVRNETAWSCDENDDDGDVDDNDVDDWDVHSFFEGLRTPLNWNCPSSERECISFLINV